MPRCCATGPQPCPLPPPPPEKYAPAYFPCGGGGDTITLGFPILISMLDVQVGRRGQLLGAADAQMAQTATSSTTPTHQRRGSANAETTPARAPAAAADRTQRPDATCEGTERVTVQGPVKEQQPDGMSHRRPGGGGGAPPPCPTMRFCKHGGPVFPHFWPFLEPSVCGVVRAAGRVHVGVSVLV